jgi:hypothetical protein
MDHILRATVVKHINMLKHVCSGERMRLEHIRLEQGASLPRKTAFRSQIQRSQYHLHGVQLGVLPYFGVSIMANLGVNKFIVGRDNG